MGFFLGGTDGEGSHDELAKEIGEAGRRWTEEHVRSFHVSPWRRPDILSVARGGHARYILRLSASSTD